MEPTESPTTSPLPQGAPADLHEGEALHFPDRASSLVDRALEVAADSSVQLVERLRLLSDLLPRAFSRETRDAPEARQIAAGVLSCAQAVLSAPSFPSEQGSFVDSVSNTMALAAATLIPNSSPEELLLVTQCCEVMDSVRRGVTRQLAVRCIETKDSLPATVLAEAFHAAFLAKLKPSQMHEVAASLLQRAHELSPRQLIRCGETLSRSKPIPSAMVEALKSEALRRLSDCSFSTACELNDLLLSFGSPSDTERRPVTDDWLTSLAQRRNEVMPRLLLIRHSMKQQAQRDALNDFERLTDELSESPSAFSPRDLIAVAAGAARVFFRNSKLSAILVERLTPLLGSLSGDDLSALARSLSKVGYRDLAFFGHVEAQLLARIKRLEPAHLLQLTASLHEVQALSGTAAQALVHHISRNRERYPQGEYLSALFCLASVRPDLTRHLCSLTDFQGVKDKGPWHKLLHSMVLSGSIPNSSSLDRRALHWLSVRKKGEPTRLEQQILRQLSGRLRSLGLEISANEIIVGIETDILIKSPNQRFIVEIDGGLHHHLTGPDGNGLSFGLDAAQDKVFRQLGYRVLHLKITDIASSQTREAALREIVRQVCEAVAPKPEKGARRVYLF